MIKIYGTPTCGWCKKAVYACEQYNLKYEYISIDTPEKQEQFKKDFPNAKTVPQITWFDNYIGGYEALMTEIENTRNYGDGP